MDAPEGECDGCRSHNGEDAEEPLRELEGETGMQEKSVQKPTDE
jgi:hypothetical protein